jgi:acetyltransferase-like isoleucine patch superfamily enzyme
MKQTFPALMRYKLTKLGASIRKSYYRFLGMQIHKGATLGKIECAWPGKVLLGKNSVIENNVVFKTPRPFSEDNFIEIGERVFIGHSCEFNITLRMTIGNNCLISSNTTFVDAGRELSRDININDQPCIHGEIHVGEDVWIGSHSVILKGVTIGKGSVIGACSLVNKSIPEYQIWAGCPARFIRNRN